MKGYTYYDDIKIINNVKYNIFKDACFALGLLDYDKEFVDSIMNDGLPSFEATADNVQKAAHKDQR